MTGFYGVLDMDASRPLTKNRDRRKISRNKLGTDAGVLCRVCGQVLILRAEELLGVHIGCVSDRTYKRKPIRGPNYGFRKSDS
jgi:hypothetical protein